MKHVVGIFKDDTLLYPIFMYPELALADQIIIILIQLGYVLWKFCSPPWQRTLISRFQILLEAA